MSDNTHEETGAESATPVEAAKDLTETPQQLGENNWQERAAAFNIGLVALCGLHDIELRGEFDVTPGVLRAIIRAYDKKAAPAASETGPAVIGSMSETLPAV